MSETDYQELYEGAMASLEATMALKDELVRQIRENPRPMIYDISIERRRPATQAEVDAGQVAIRELAFARDALADAVQKIRAEVTK